MILALIFLSIIAATNESKAGPLEDMDKKLKELYDGCKQNLLYAKKWEKSLADAKSNIPVLKENKEKIEVIAKKKRKRRDSIPDDEIRDMQKYNSSYIKAMKASMDAVEIMKDAPRAMARPIVQGRSGIEKCSKILDTVAQEYKGKMELILELYNSQS